MAGRSIKVLNIKRIIPVEEVQRLIARAIASACRDVYDRADELSK